MTQDKERPSGLVKLAFKVPMWLYRAHLRRELAQSGTIIAFKPAEG